jgi:hypothetical protein
MRNILRFAVALALTSSLGGCFVVAHPAHGVARQPVAERECGPAHHWDGNTCVHNGEARGHDKHDRD